MTVFTFIIVMDLSRVCHDITDTPGLATPTDNHNTKSHSQQEISRILGTSRIRSREKSFTGKTVGD